MPRPSEAFEHLLHQRDLVPRQQAAVILVDADALGHLLRRALRVAGEHDGLFHARLTQGGQGLAHVVLLHVGDQDMPGVLPVERHMDDRARAAAGDERHAKLIHELVVARGDAHAIHRGEHSAAADLLDVGDAGAVGFLAVVAADALADGVGGGALGQSGVLDELVVAERAVVDAADLEHAAGDGAGLVEDHGLDLGERLEIVRALDEDALPAGPADARRRSSAGWRSPARRGS